MNQILQRVIEAKVQEHRNAYVDTMNLITGQAALLNPRKYVNVLKNPLDLAVAGYKPKVLDNKRKGFYMKSPVSKRGI